MILSIIILTIIVTNNDHHHNTSDDSNNSNDNSECGRSKTCIYYEFVKMVISRPLCNIEHNDVIHARAVQHGRLHLRARLRHLHQDVLARRINMIL